MNVRQEKFVQAYLKDPNATQAAIAAGYSAKTAAQIAARLLRNVEIQQAIRKVVDRAAEKAGLTLQSHLDELARIRDAAFVASQYGPAITAEVSRGKAVGLYVERSESKVENTHRMISDEEREARVLDIVMAAKSRKERGLVS